MTTYPLFLPDALAERLSALPVEKMQMVTDEVTEFVAELVEEAEAAALPLDLVTALTEGFADADAGRVTSWDSVYAKMQQQLALLQAPVNRESVTGA